MDAHWFFSQVYTDPDLNMTVPVCNAYGGQYFCPTYPSTPTGWALVQMLANAHQLEAAKQDQRVLVLPITMDPTPLPQQVTDNYASWGATTGMSLAALLCKLAETEPVFGNSL